MPKNPVTDPITDQEITFARLVLAGTMNDRQAAEAAGLNPNTAAYTKAKPQVRAWMAEHRAASNETLRGQEAEAFRTLQARREQILARLWHLANLDPEATRGSIAGQIKAMSMIVAIEGLIPNRRGTAASAQTASPAHTPPTYVAEPLRPQRDAERTQRDAERTQQSETIPSAEAPATPSHRPEPPPQPTAAADLRPHHGIHNPIPSPTQTNRVPDAMGHVYDAHVEPVGALQLPALSRNGSNTRVR
jgi:hypothetical protein